MPSPLDQPEQPTPAELNGGEVQAQADVDQPPQPLAIEFGEATQIPDDNPPADEPVQKLDVGQGDAVKLDALGPMIINTDGTLSRIQNWHELSEFERERTVRVLVKKRNVVRLQKLRDDEAALEQQSTGSLSNQAES